MGMGGGRLMWRGGWWEADVEGGGLTDCTPPVLIKYNKQRNQT